MTNLDLLLNAETDEELKKVGENLAKLFSLTTYRGKYSPGSAEACEGCPAYEGWPCDCGSMYYDTCSELYDYSYSGDDGLVKFVCKERGYCPSLQIARDLRKSLLDTISEEKP